MGVGQAIVALRQAGIAPTRGRMMVLALAFGDEAPPQTAEDLRERASDAGICMSAQAAEDGLGELRRVGLLPPATDGQTRPAPDIPEASRLLKAMGSPHRLAVLCELRKGERCVSQLQRVAGIEQSALSQHLARLKADGLVRIRRQSCRIYYRLADTRVASVLGAL